MPIEIELLLAAWDNAKKNAFGGDGWNIDPETGEVITGEMPDDLADLVADIDDKMMDLAEHYNSDAGENIFYGEDDESPFVGVRYDADDEDRVREAAENL